MKFAVGQRWKNRLGDTVVIECIDGSKREGTSDSRVYPVFANGKSFTPQGRYFEMATDHHDLVQLIDPPTLTHNGLGNYSLLVLSGQPIYSLPSK